MLLVLTSKLLKRRRTEGMKVGEEQPIVDWNEIESRRVSDGYELQCPKCKSWFRSLLATIGGTMCRRCWLSVRGEKSIYRQVCEKYRQ